MAALTYLWLNANCAYFTAIADAIHQHNQEIRLKAFEEVKKLIKEIEDIIKDESEDEGELVETVTETTSKS